MERPFRATGSESARMPPTRREERRIRPTAAFRQQNASSRLTASRPFCRYSLATILCLWVIGQQCVAACKTPDRTALSLSISFLTAYAVEQKIILILESFIHTPERYATSERSLNRKSRSGDSQAGCAEGATGLMRRYFHELPRWRQGPAMMRKRAFLAHAFKSSYDGR